MNLLLTSVGRRTYLVEYFKDALQPDGLVHAGNSEPSPALRAADRAVLTPLIYDKSYAGFLLSYCLKNNITAIISFFDVDLPVLAQKKEEFKKNGIAIVVSDYAVTQLCNDKWKTFQFLNDHGLSAPKTFIHLHEAHEALKKSRITFPLIIKPRWGMGSIGVHRVDNSEELAVFYNRLKRDIFRTYLSFESDRDPENCVLIQERLQGDEYAIDVVNDLKGNYVTTLVKKKISMRAGETDHAITEESFSLSALGGCLSQKLRHIANLAVDCFTCQGRPYVLEMNGRIGGSYPFAHLAGANLPLAIVTWLKGEEPEKELFTMEYSVEGIKDINPIKIEKSLQLKYGGSKIQA